MFATGTHIGTIVAIFIAVCACEANAQQPDFIRIPAATYSVGKANHKLNPKRKITIKSFEIAAKEVTNTQFEEFVNATHYRTDAEKRHDALIFIPGLKEFEWINDSTAFWRYPNGKGRGGIENKMNHPVTCISYHDAEAYCNWANVRLPNLEEWEIACRAGTETDCYFGNNRNQISTYGNVWLGTDHLQPDSSDGFMYTSPVAMFVPNAWGLYDMYGNVFEFCSGSLPGDTNQFVKHARGGSWWCSIHACSFFNSYDIGRVHERASFSNQGFRVVKKESH